LLDKLEHLVQVVKVGLFAVAHVVYGTAPDSDPALAIQRLVPNANYEGKSVTLQLRPPGFTSSRNRQGLFGRGLSLIFWFYRQKLNICRSTSDLA